MNTHLKLWGIQFLLSYFMNWIGLYPVSFVGYCFFFLIVVGCFYLLSYFLRKFNAPTSILPLALIVLAVFGVTVAIATVLIYDVLPRWNIYWFDPEQPIHLGNTVQQTYRSYFPVLIAAIAYHQYTMNAQTQRRLLDSERQRAEAVERQLNLERAQRKTLNENLTMQSALLANQLGSHWLHSIFDHVKAALIHNEYAAKVVEAYVDTLRYLYSDSGIRRGMVLLEVELAYIRKMVFLNAVALPDAVDIEMNIAPHLVAREIPRLLFGTVVENAFHYAEQNDPDHPPRIEVSSGPERLRFFCWNKKMDPPPDNESTAVGLATIQQLLDLNYPQNHRITITDNSDSFSIEILLAY